MGPNGSGKSTLAQVLMGNPAYKLGSTHYELKIDGKDIRDEKPDQRGRDGLFLGFQNPISIPGVNVANLLRVAYQQRHGKEGKKAAANPALTVWKFNELLLEKAKQLGIQQEFLRRGLNEDFSGGEKKKLEMLQAVILAPKYAIFDEIDTGLDVDALKIVASAIDMMKKKGTGILIITHYQRILHFAKPDRVSILAQGKIVQSGNFKLAQEIEKTGYKKWIKN